MIIPDIDISGTSNSLSPTGTIGSLDQESLNQIRKDLLIGWIIKTEVHIAKTNKNKKNPLWVGSAYFGFPYFFKYGKTKQNMFMRGHSY